MATIDTYKHKILGLIDCPSTYDFVLKNKTREIVVYQIFEDIPQDEEDFDGKIGDIIVGGGSGESPSLRISNPIAFKFFTYDEDKFADIDFHNLTEVFKSYWTPTESFIYCEGFAKLGWTVDRDIGMWLAGNVCKLLVSTLKEFEMYKTNNSDLSTNLTFTIFK